MKRFFEVSLCVGAQDEALGPLIAGHFVELVEVPHHVAPLGIDAGGGETLVELLAEKQREEGAEQSELQVT